MADVILDKERADLALRAIYEMETLICMIKREIDNDETSTTEYLLPVFLQRMRDINSVAMSVLGGDDGRETSEMVGVIYA